MVDRYIPSVGVHTQSHSAISPMAFDMEVQPLDSVDVLTVLVVVAALCAIVVMGLYQDWRRR